MSALNDDAALSAVSPNDDDAHLPNEAAVVAFLRERPDFFSTQPELLSELHLRHDSGDATSLMERQVAVLRDRNMAMRKRLAMLLTNAAANDRLFAKIRTLTLALMQADRITSLDATLAKQLTTEFSVDSVACYLFDGYAGALAGALADAPHAETASLQCITVHRRATVNEETGAATQIDWLGDQLRHSDPSFNTYRADEFMRLFHGDPVSSPGSAAIVPILVDEQAPIGALAIGSHDAGRFSNHDDTLFIEFLADALGQALRRVLLTDPPIESNAQAQA